jgi:RNA polymerase sigma-70 factor (ECF subfamily)
VLRRSEPQHPAGRALAALYREHATATYRFALHMCGSRADAEDLTQTAFLAAHRKMLAGEELVSPRAWLASVVRTRALNLRRDRHDIAASDRLEQLAAAVDPVETGEDLSRVRAVLWSLPEAQHQAFVLRHWCDVSNRDIAGMLDTTEAAVESLLVRARRAIGGIDDLPADCMETRERLTKGLPDTPRVRSHLAGCRGCRTASDRIAGAAAVAGVLALAPRIGVAQSLAATVPGFTTAAATSTGAGVAGAAATKALIAKAVVASVVVGAAATAVHSGVVHLPVPHIRAAAAHAAPQPAPAGSDPAGSHTAPPPHPAPGPLVKAGASHDVDAHHVRHRDPADHDAAAPPAPQGQPAAGQNSQGGDDGQGAAQGGNSDNGDAGGNSDGNSNGGNTGGSSGQNQQGGGGNAGTTSGGSAGNSQGDSAGNQQ